MQPTSLPPRRRGRSTRGLRLVAALACLPTLTFCGGSGLERNDAGILEYRYPECASEPDYPQPPTYVLYVQVVVDASRGFLDDSALWQIAAELDVASAIFRPSGLALSFDPTSSVSQRSEGIPSGALDDGLLATLNGIAGAYPNRLVLFLRHGTSPSSGLGHEFVDLPIDDREGVLYAHEIGHFLGLSHTFFERCSRTPYAAPDCELRADGGWLAPTGAPTWDLPALIRQEMEAVYGPRSQWTTDVAAAARGLGYRVRDELLDGDGLADTPPAIWATTGDVRAADCTHKVPIRVVFGENDEMEFDFTPCTWNPMSYYFRCAPAGRLWFSAAQTDIMRNHLLSPDGVRHRLLWL